jgi:hypothetical protein
MTRTYQLVAVVVFCLGLASALLISQGTVVRAEQKPDSPLPIGRYQQYKSAVLDGECLLDTATGKVWRLLKDQQRFGKGQWVLAVEGPK